jgi:hypothetical protein
MPVKVRKLPGRNKFRVSHGGKISAKATTLEKALKQEKLLNAVGHGWKPTGRGGK